MYDNYHIIINYYTNFTSCNECQKTGCLLILCFDAATKSSLIQKLLQTSMTVRVEHMEAFSLF